MRQGRACRWRVAATAWLATLFVGEGYAQTVGPERVQQIVGGVCVACHGADGNSAEPANPKLAGLQPEYIAKQLKDYKAGKRQSDVMSPIVANMDLSSEEIEALAAYFSRQKAAAGTVRDKALLDLGRKIYADGNEENGVPACAGCHNADGGGTSRFPRLAGQHQDYTVQQLKLFAASKRENDRGLVMQSVAMRMSEQEIKAVAEYIAGLQ